MCVYKARGSQSESMAVAVYILSQPAPSTSLFSATEVYQYVYRRTLAFKSALVAQNVRGGDVGSEFGWEAYTRLPSKEGVQVLKRVGVERVSFRPLFYDLAVAGISFPTENMERLVQGSDRVERGEERAGQDDVDAAVDPGKKGVLGWFGL